MNEYNFVEHDKRRGLEAGLRDESRAFEMATMYVENHSTLEEIGTKYNLSRERVRQILYKVLTPEQNIAIKEFNSQVRREKRLANREQFTTNCKQCGATIVSYVKSKVFCSDECKDKFREIQKKVSYKNKVNAVKNWQRRNKDKIREYNKKSYELVKADPVKWEKAKKRARDYRNERYKNDPEFRERLLKQYKESIERRSKDPEFIKKRKEYQKERIKKLKQDPIKWAEYVERQRAKSRENYAKVKELRKKYDPTYKERKTNIFFC